MINIIIETSINTIIENAISLSGIIDTQDFSNHHYPTFDEMNYNELCLQYMTDLTKNIDTLIHLYDWYIYYLHLHSYQNDASSIMFFQTWHMWPL